MGSCRKRWSDLSGDEEREIMRRLPLKTSFALREVCKSWNNTLSSPTLWGPCILLSPAKPTLPSLLYSLSSPLCLSMEWQALQLRIPQHQKIVMGKPRETMILHRGSSQGILLVQMASHLAFGMAMCTANNLHVCNPLTGISTKVPTQSDSYGVSKYVAHAIMVAGSGLGTFVAMMAKTNHDDTLVVQVMRMNSTTFWCSTMVNLPPEVCTASSRVVLCNSSCDKILRLFCLVKTALVDDKDGSGSCSGGFDAVLTVEMDMTEFSNKKCGLVSLPKVLTNNGGLMCLFSCGRSAAMLATGVENIKGCIQEVVIWELRYGDGCDLFWVNVDTMPRLVMSAMMNGRDWGNDERMCTSSPWMECVGVGEYCCFRAHESNRMVAFHAKTKRWECLPCFPENYRYLHLTSMAFHPSTTSPL